MISCEIFVHYTKLITGQNNTIQYKNIIMISCEVFVRYTKLKTGQNSTIRKYYNDIM